MIEIAIIKLLLQNTALTAIVGDRIYPNISKSPKFPVVYVAANRMERMPCDNDYGVKTGVIEIGVMGGDYIKCLNAISAIRQQLDDLSAKIGNVGISILKGQEAPDGYDDETEVHLKTIEYQAFARISSTT